MGKRNVSIFLSVLSILTVGVVFCVGVSLFGSLLFQPAENDLGNALGTVFAYVLTFVYGSIACLGALLLGILSRFLFTRSDAPSRAAGILSVLAIVLPVAFLLIAGGLFLFSRIM